jgi:hypothetical protein
MATTVISFYTPNGKYPYYATRLANSLDKFKIKHSIQELPTQPTFKDTIALKIPYIITKLCEYRDAVIWLDVDCEVLQYPTLLFDGRYDFACYNWTADITQHRFKYEPKKLTASGALYRFGYTAPAMELLFRANKYYSDDDSISRVYNEDKPPVTPLWLPKTYLPLFGEPKEGIVIQNTFKGHGGPDDRQRIWETENKQENK